MKAPLSQHFKLSSSSNYKRAHFDESNPSSSRDQLSRPSQLQSMKTDPDYIHRRSTPSRSDLQHSNPISDFQTRGYTQQQSHHQDSTAVGSNYRSVQQPSISYVNQQFRSPSTLQPGLSNSAFGQRNEPLNYLRTQGSREEDQYTGGADRKIRLKTTYQDQGRTSLSGRNNSHLKNNFMINNSVDQSTTGKYQPQLADYSPQIINNSSKRPYSHQTNELFSSHIGVNESHNPISKFNLNSERRQGTTESPMIEDQANKTLNQDMEHIIMSLHNKMKNLESKYIDLANFYKKELVTQKQTLDHSPYTLNRDSMNRSKSPHRFGEHSIDQTVEKAIISELLQEKGDLEKELQNMIHIQNRMMDEEGRLTDKIDHLDKENQQLRTRSGGRTTQSDFSRDNIEQLRSSVQAILDRFENEFLDFINSNYQSFTENDVLGLFSNLKIQIAQVLDSLSRVNSARQPFSTIQPSNEQAQLLDKRRKKILDEYKKELNEYEINNQYTLQNIKKATFELKNKHDTTKLDLKKATMTLQSLATASNELSSMNPSNMSSYERPNSSSHQKSTILDFRLGGTIQSPSMGHQKRLVSEIQTQVQTLQHVFSSINRKIGSCDIDIKVLGDIENECQNNIDQLKESYEKMIQQFNRQPFRVNASNFGDENEEVVPQSVAQKHLLELKVINDKLQRELHMSSDKFNSLKIENQSLIAQIENNRSVEKGKSTSPFLREVRNTYEVANNLRTVGQSVSSQSSIQEEQSAYSNKIHILENENHSLTRRIQTLTRTLDEKQYELDKMGHNFQQLSTSQNRPNSGNQVSVDQVAFYQRMADSNQNKTRQLIKLTQRFLYAMKKLQKAVHRKEQNVQKEKHEFEISRKELELLLKQLKKEVGDDAATDSRIPRINEASRQSALRASSQGMISNDDQTPVVAQIHKYQNKVPHTLSARNQEKPISMRKQSVSNQAQQHNTQHNQSHHYSVNQSLGASSVLYDNNRTVQEKSPIPLRTKNHGNMRNSRQQQEMFHSIEPVDRRHNTLLASIERSTQNRSPSHDPFGQRINLDNQQTTLLNQTLQVSNMKNEIDLLRQEIQDLMQERESLSTKVGKVEMEKDGLIAERQQIEKHLDRERKKHDAARREINDLELEKESLIQELKRIPQDSRVDLHHSQSRELQDAKDQYEKMFEQLQIVERINQEYQRTIGFLEESAEMAKQTIIDLKESLALKDLEIEEMISTQQHIRQDQSAARIIKQELVDLEKLKTDLETMIENACEENEQKMQELEIKIQTKEHEIGKVKRQLERKIKEKEIQNMQQQNANGEQNQAKIIELQRVIQDLEHQLDVKQSNPVQQEDQDKLQQQLLELQDQLEAQKLEYEVQVNEQKQESQEQLLMMQRNEQENFEMMLQQKDLEMQEQIFKVNQENIQALQKLKEEKSKMKSDNEQKIKQLESRLQEAEEEYQRSLAEQKAQIVGLQGKDQQEQMRKLEESLKARWEKEATMLQVNFKDQQRQLSQQYEDDIERLNEQIVELRKDMGAKDKLVSTLKYQKSEVEMQLKVLQAENDQALSIAHQEWQDKLNSEKTQLNSKQEKEINSIKQTHQKQVDQLSKQVKDKERELEQLQHITNEQEEILRKAQNDGSSQTQSLKQQMDLLKSQIKSKDLELQGLNIRIDELQNEVVEWQGQAEDQFTQLTTKDETITSLQGDFQAEKQKSFKSLAEIQAKLDKALREREDLNLKLESLELNEQSLQHQLALEKQSKEDLKTRLTDQNKQSQLKVTQLQERVNELQQKYDQLSMDKDGKVHELTLREQELQRQTQQEQQMKDELKNKLNEMMKTSQQQTMNIQQDYQSQVQELERDKLLLTEQIQALEGEITANKLQVNSKAAQYDELNQLHAKIKSELNAKEGELSAMKQQMSDAENESKYVKSMRQSLQTQLDKIQKELQDKDAASISQKAQMCEELYTKEALISKLEEEIEAKQRYIVQTDNKVHEQQEQIAKLHKQQENEQEHMNAQIRQMQEEMDNLRQEREEAIAKKDQQIKDIQSEKAKLQDQVREMVNQTTFEKQSLEAQLQKQLNDTLQQLQVKEGELGNKEQQVAKLDKQVRELQHSVQEQERKMKAVEEENEQLVEENQAMEDQRQSNQQQLEKNRDVIQMLKTELKKSMDKAKVLEQEQTQATGQKDQENGKEIEQMKQQNVELRQQFEDKLMEQKMQYDTLETELKMKNELIEDANRYIEEFNDEKHELKAKFKHLAQVLDEVEEESLYKEDEDLDLEELFSRFEKEFLRNRRKIESKIESVERENSLLKEQVKLNKEECEALEANMKEVRKEVDRAQEKLVFNTEEMKKQIETAQRKIQNYKDKLIEKQKYINQIENEKRHQQESVVSVAKEQSLLKENLELLQKLQKAENELQSVRKDTQSRQPAKGVSHDSALDDSLRVDAQRLSQIEDQLINLRKQLFQAKDQVTDQLAEQFSKKFKDLSNTFRNEQILKAKLSEMKSESQMQQVLNNNIKIVKLVVLGAKRLLIVQVISNNECYVIDEQKLPETAVQFVKSYVPEDEMEETQLHYDDKQLQLMDKLTHQIKDIKEERQELQQELALYKSKLLSGQAFEEMHDLKQIELEDDVGHLTAENQELSGKLKQLSEKNHLQQVRIIELNELIKDLTTKTDADSANRKLIKLKEDNDSLRQQLLTVQRKPSLKHVNPKSAAHLHHDEEELEEGSFLQGIQVADNLNTSQPDNNLFDQSSLYGVIGELEGDNKQQQMEQTIGQLQKQLEEAQKSNKVLQSEIQKSQEQTLNPNEQSTINHIKGTLIQFLKNTPLTDKNNEELLAIIFSIMGFSRDEITEVQDYRRRQRATSQSSGQPTDPDEDMRNKAKKGIFGMFKKRGGDKESSVSRSNKEEQLVSPARPLKRN